MGQVNPKLTVGGTYVITYQSGKILCREAVITYCGDGVSCYREGPGGSEYSICHLGHTVAPVTDNRTAAIDKAASVLDGIWNSGNDTTQNREAAAILFDAGNLKVDV